MISRRIKVDKHLLEPIVHPSIWLQRPFKFDPMGFVPESNRIEQKIVDASKQEQSLAYFESNPNAPMIYVVAGNPDDSKAKYFASYLVEIHVKSQGSKADVIWETMTGSWESPAMKRDQPSLLVLSNLTDISSKVKLEKARDLIEKWPTIPRIIVCAGEDPISFAVNRLRTAAHGIAYFWSRSNKMVQEVI